MKFVGQDTCRAQDRILRRDQFSALLKPSERMKYFQLKPMKKKTDQSIRIEIAGQI